jgi:nitrogen fixation/metabolism regulation signal transduction histidine kinase
MRFRYKALLVFVAATAAPLAATAWLALSLLSHSLDLSAGVRIDDLASTLEETARRLYQREREALRADADAGRVKAQPLDRAIAGAEDFELSGERERFVLGGDGGSRLYLLRRRAGGIDVYARDIGVRMNDVTEAYRSARKAAKLRAERDFSRGFGVTFLLLTAILWCVSLALLWWMLGRGFRPLEQLTAALGRLAKGDDSTRIGARASNDEIGRAVAAFNSTAAELEARRDRLVHLTQVASWRLLARKMAHELKNSLTPIRLTVEEMLARAGAQDREFGEQATRIVVGEIEGLERRLRAFSDFAAEPEVRIEALDARSLIEERITLLAPQYPEVRFEVAGESARVLADRDLLCGIVTNLLKNGAEAMGGRGAMRCRLSRRGAMLLMDFEDEGPGVPAQQREALFEPVISSKKGGMGLGLTIARRNALLIGGDLALVDGAGACFRLSAPLEESA